MSEVLNYGKQSRPYRNDNENSHANFRITKLLVKTLLLGKRFLISDQVSPLRSEEDLTNSRKLLYKEYLRYSLCEPNSSGLYLNIFSFLPSTTTLISQKSKKTTGTITAIEDGILGLPADTLYKAELDQFRSRGFTLTEVGALALDNSRFKKSTHSLKSLKKFSTMATLFAGLVNHVYQFTNSSHLVIMVNPKHVPIYKFIGFKQFSDIRHYPIVNKPAVPMIIDVEHLVTVEDDRPLSLFFVSSMKLMRKEKCYKGTPGEVSKLMLNEPTFFENLSAEEEVALLKIYPELATVLRIFKSRPKNMAPENFHVRTSGRSSTMDHTHKEHDSSV